MCISLSTPEQTLQGSAELSCRMQRPLDTPIAAAKDNGNMFASERKNHLGAANTKAQFLPLKLRLLRNKIRDGMDNLLSMGLHTDPYHLT